MKTYVTTTGILFGLLTLVHIWRATVETHLASDPWYILMTIAAATLCFWALGLVWRSRRS
jgi:hypothetical protein